MANPFASAMRSFWHAMTSNDRHASHDSPYRTGQHMPISQNRHAPLTSIATSASESHSDLPTTYQDDSKRPSISTHSVGQSPSRPYSPGMRSLSSPKINSVDETIAPGEIQMQNFADGAPPPPPVTHSWKKIEKWCEKHYPELFDQLGEGATQNDVNELEHELDLSLPQDVRESLTVHDGQERGGRPTGMIFGCMLLDCEEIVQEWKNWKVVNEEYLSGAKKPQAHYPLKSLNAPSSSSSASHHQPANGRTWRQELLDRQESQPPKAIQKAYAHPSWICLARDWGGNNIAIDLAPGPMGKWGQVILFGRDYDCKYVVARSWSHFLAVVADDLLTEKSYVDEDTGDLRLREFRSETVEPAYMDILRWRADQKYGRRGPRRKPNAPPGLNTNINGVNKSSPYGSPTVEDRGRSPQRFSRPGAGSPRHTVSSPLARVQEEPVKAGGDYIKDFATNNGPGPALKAEKLVDAPTPIDTTAPYKHKLVDVPTPITAKGERKEFPLSGLSRTTTEDDNKENQVDHPNVRGLGVDGVDGEMKNVTI